MYISLTDKWGERCRKRKKTLAVLSLWKDTNLPALSQGTYAILAPCFWENTGVLPATSECAEVWHFVPVYAVSSPALWEGPETRTQTTSFSCASNYYSILLLVKSGRALSLFLGGPELDLLWPKVLQLNSTYIYSGHFVFRLIRSMAELNVLQHRQNTFRLSIKRISDISALIQQLQQLSRSHVICYILYFKS